jgi:hypothetical protein
MKHRIVLLLTAFCMVIAACGNQEMLTATSPSVEPNDISTSTPDPCAAENLEQSIKHVNDLMREFTDAYQLASSVAKEQVAPIISNMQRIRRAAEDQRIPACLAELKAHQLAHMNTLIEVMLAFVGGADSASLSDGLTKAQTEYDLYTSEVASLLGIETTPTSAP